jgi:rfaE bifunctional protein kinase chain/domain
MNDLAKRLTSMIPRFRGRRVMVVGDLVADRYLLAEPARLSREAPVIVAREVGEETILGGAANAVHNLVTLGAQVVPIGAVGEDHAGRALIAKLAEREMDVSGVVVDAAYATVCKTRVMVGDSDRMKQQVLRIDREPPGPPGEECRVALLDAIRTRLSGVDAVLLSDYGYGIVDAATLEVILSAPGERVVTADSRYEVASLRGVSLATPNEGELEEALGVRIRDAEDLDKAGRTLLDVIGTSALLVTRGNRGMSLFVRGEPRRDIPATGTSQVTDVSGAGDTVIAVATLALAAGASILEAAHLANAAAGVVVMKLGAAACAVAELEEACSGLA